MIKSSGRREKGAKPRRNSLFQNFEDRRGGVVKAFLRE
jgi:hypothetical protein